MRSRILRLTKYLASGNIIKVNSNIIIKYFAYIINFCVAVNYRWLRNTYNMIFSNLFPSAYDILLQAGISPKNGGIKSVEIILWYRHVEIISNIIENQCEESGGENETAVLKSTEKIVVAPISFVSFYNMKRREMKSASASSLARGLWKWNALKRLNERIAQVNWQASRCRRVYLMKYRRRKSR